MRGRSYDPLKRVIDVVAAVAGLVVTSPALLVTAVLVRLRLGSPIFFRQQRPGKDDEIFELVKFRTMTQARPGEGVDTDGARLTPLGATLRATSLDELPSLWNILKGDMSLVGPRPLLVAYLDRYDSTQRRRHEVRPGLTGLAQVNGRNALSWEEKFAYDVEYVDRRSLALDLKILWHTALVTVRRSGIAATGSATMPEFLGSADVGSWPQPEVG